MGGLCEEEIEGGCGRNGIGGGNEWSDIGGYPIRLKGAVIYFFTNGYLRLFCFFVVPFEFLLFYFLNYADSTQNQKFSKPN